MSGKLNSPIKFFTADFFDGDVNAANLLLLLDYGDYFLLLLRFCGVILLFGVVYSYLGAILELGDE